MGQSARGLLAVAEAEHAVVHLLPPRHPETLLRLAQSLKQHFGRKLGGCVFWRGGPWGGGKKKQEGGERGGRVVGGRA